MLKRFCDILISSIVLICFLPIGVLIALAIKFDSSGSVFFRQQRIGLHGKAFGLLKFRSMRVASQSQGTLTVGMRDPRITKVGVFIRRFKLDEFPQFLNVILGDMSIVGPRPEVEEYVLLYDQNQKRVLSVKPGITDYASIQYFKENEILAKSENPRKAYIEEIMPDKLRLNLKYIEEKNLFTDLKIIWKTALKIFS